MVGAYGAKTDNGLTLPGTDSQAAFDILARRFPPQQNGTNPFVFSVDEGKLTDPDVKPAITATYKAIKTSPAGLQRHEPRGKDGAAAGILSEDGKTGFMPVLLTIDSGFITERLAQDLVDGTEAAHEPQASRWRSAGRSAESCPLPRPSESELIGNIAAMVILALVFGSLIAMGTPIITAAFALTIGPRRSGCWATRSPIASVAPTLATMIGLGVGIDYALFLVTKHLDQLDDGIEMEESIATLRGVLGQRHRVRRRDRRHRAPVAVGRGHPAGERARLRVGDRGVVRGARVDHPAARDPVPARGLGPAACACRRS